MCTGSIFNFVGLLFELLYIAQSLDPALNKGDVLSALNLKVWIDAFLPSFIPPIAMFVWLRTAERGLNSVFILLACAIVCAITFLGCRAAYECLSEWRGYYWHEALLGCFSMWSFGMAWRIVSDTGTLLNLDRREPLLFEER